MSPSFVVRVCGGSVTTFIEDTRCKIVQARVVRHRVVQVGGKTSIVDLRVALNLIKNLACNINFTTPI